MNQRTIKSIQAHSTIDGLIPGVKGQRAFPTPYFKESDPFLLLDHIGPQKVGAGWHLNGDGHDHPHRGFETITFMFEGSMKHCDSIGNKATLTSGSVQRMNAGSGIIHGGSMYADPHTELFHEMQLWVNNPHPEKMSKPDIHNLSDRDIPSMKYGNIRLRAVAGSLNGLVGPIQTKASTQIGHLIARGNGKIEISSFSEDYHLMIYVMEGDIQCGKTTLSAFQLANFHSDGNGIVLEANGFSQTLVLSGKPLNESIVFGGPFVMNTEEEIRQAQADFQNGLFGKIG